MLPKSKTTYTLPTLRDLVDAGAQFGHRRSRSYPKARQFTFTVRDRVFVINLEKTLEYLAVAKTAVQQWASEGKTILFVGTKPQAAESVLAAATAAGQPYIHHRWLGGILTNFATIKRNLDTLAALEQVASTERFTEFTKQERGRISKRITKLNKILGGIKDLERVPDALIIVDITEEEVATAEARKLGLPVVGLVDTNANPDLVSHPIPVNDDSRKAIELILGQLVEAIVAGKAQIPAPKVAGETASKAEKMEAETDSGLSTVDPREETPETESSAVQTTKKPVKKTTVKSKKVTKTVKKTTTSKSSTKR